MNFSAEEMLEEEEGSDAAFDETVNSDFNTWPLTPLSYVLKLPDASTLTQGTQEHSDSSQQPLAFENGSNIDGEISALLVSFI